MGFPSHSSTLRSQRGSWFVHGRLLVILSVMSLVIPQMSLAQQPGKAKLSDLSAPASAFDTYMSKGSEEVGKRNWEAAATQYAEALKLDPQNAQAHLLMSLVQMNLMKIQPAWFHARQAARLDLRNPKAVSHFMGLWGSFSTQGMFNVGVSAEMLLERLGEPDQQIGNGARQQLVYGFFAINVVDGKLFSIVDLRQMKGGNKPAADVIAFQIPEEGWALNYRMMNAQYANSEYTPNGETVQNWTQMFSTRRSIGLLEQTTMESYVQRIESILRQVAATGELDWKLHYKDDKRIVYEWSIKNVPGKEDQWEMAACFAGQSDVHTIAYANKTLPQDPAVRQKWMKVLTSAKLLTTDQYREMMNQANAGGTVTSKPDGSAFVKLEKSAQLDICRQVISRHIQAIQQQNVEQVQKLFTPRLRSRIDQPVLEKLATSLQGVTAEMLIDQVEVVQQKPVLQVKAFLPKGRTLTTFVWQDGEFLADTIWFQ